MRRWSHYSRLQSLCKWVQRQPPSQCQKCRGHGDHAELLHFKPCISIQINITAHAFTAMSPISSTTTTTTTAGVTPPQCLEFQFVSKRSHTIHIYMHGRSVGLFHIYLITLAVPPLTKDFWQPIVSSTPIKDHTCRPP